MPVDDRRRGETLCRIEAYLDTAPRANSTTEEIGPFTLFVPRAGWPYYARPRLGSATFTLADIHAVHERQRNLGLPTALEWVDDVTPSLLPVAREAGLNVRLAPLLVLGDVVEARPPDGVAVRMLVADDAALPATSAAIALGFAAAGTAVGAAGPEDRAAAVAAADATSAAFLREQLRRDLVVMAVAEDRDGPVGGGSHLLRGDVAEVAGVATLPSARRRGIGAAVTAVLVGDARRRGADLIFLSAGSEDIARVYVRAGFRRFATSCISE